jgi:hypothetical protein
MASGHLNCGLGAECDVGSAYEVTCEGDELVLCNAGRIDRVDCKALGFEGAILMWGFASRVRGVSGGSRERLRPLAGCALALASCGSSQ